MTAGSDQARLSDSVQGITTENIGRTAKLALSEAVLQAPSFCWVRVGQAEVKVHDGGLESDVAGRFGVQGTTKLALGKTVVGSDATEPHEPQHHSSGTLTLHIMSYSGRG